MYLDLAASLSGGVMAASRLDGEVSVWTLSNLQHVATLQTTLDPLGPRLAVVGLDGSVVVITGSWERREVAAYDAGLGSRRWVRPRLPRIQLVAPARDGSAVAVAFDRGPIQILDVSTGQRIAEIPGGRAFWQSPLGSYGAVRLASRVAGVDVTDWHITWTARVAGFASLAAAFSPGGVLISDSADADGPEPAELSAYSLSGTRLWTYRGSHETNVPWVGWDAEADHWLGVEHNVNRSHSDTLVRWTDTGEVLDRTRLSTVEPYVFADEGRLLATSTGQLFDTRTVREVGKLPLLDQT